MTHSPLALKRRHVLGDLYSKCDAIESIPVYLGDEKGEVLGHVDEGLGHYADAFTFHLAEDVCKRLATGHYDYSFNYDFSDPDAAPGRSRRVKLNSICLTGRKPMEPVGSRSRKVLPVAAAEAEVVVAAK